jgi:hypothetical protein
LKSPQNDAERYLKELYDNKKLAFDNRADSKIAIKSRDIAYAYFKLKSEGKTINFNQSEDPFADCFNDRYNIY